MDEKEKIERLKSMLEHAKALTKAEDPVLDGQSVVLLGLIHDILRAKDPENSFEHIVEYE